MTVTMVTDRPSVSAQLRGVGIEYRFTVEDQNGAGQGEADAVARLSSAMTVSALALRPAL